MPPGPTTDDVLGTVTLLHGKAEFLAEREIADVRDAVHTAAADSDVTDVIAASTSPGHLVELMSPSLFASVRCVVVRGLDLLPDDVVDPLLSYAAAPSPDVVLVLAHPGGQRGSGLVTKLKKLPSVRSVGCEQPKPWELARFVVAEVRRARGQIEPDAAEQLAVAVGEDLRALSGAVHQLVADFEGRRITGEIVGRYFEGRAEVKGFEVADLALSGQLGGALERLRQARAAGTAEVLVVAAMASGLRGLARLATVSGAGSRAMRDADLAREVGVPPFKLKSMRVQLRGWERQGLVDAIHATAAADLAVKGGAGDPDHALERLVLQVVEARGAD